MSEIRDGIRAVQTRCLVTGNPVGTDTWRAGNPCRCANCSKTATAMIGGTTREVEGSGEPESRSRGCALKPQPEQERVV